MIPKIIHQTWSDDPVPRIINYIRDENAKLLKSLGYEIILWTDKMILKLINDEYPDFYKIYNSARTGVQRGDIARILLIYHYGGIYIDLDVLVLRDFSELLDMTRDTFYISYEPAEQTKLIYNSDRYICNAFFAANKNNVFLHKLLRNIPEYINRHGYDLFSKFDIFGGFYILTNINNYDKEKKNNDIFIIEDRELIYPINDLKLENIPSTDKDWCAVRTGKYTTNPIMIHYWIHGDFESKNLLKLFKPDATYDIHHNMYIFFKILYPNVEKIDNLS
jgi:hypothetical protein